MTGPARQVPVVNVANVLTAARLVLVPVFAMIALIDGLGSSGWRIVACLVFVVASVTDYVDGWIARTWDMVTSFGKVADPIADKLLTGTALVLLSAYGRLTWWITILILVREWGVTALRLWVIRHGVIAASRGGKAKTALQTLAIAWYLWPFPAPVGAVGYWLMLVAVVVTVLTGADYVVRAVRLRRGGRVPWVPVGTFDEPAPAPATAPAVAPPSDEVPA